MGSEMCIRDTPQAQHWHFAMKALWFRCFVQFSRCCLAQPTAIAGLHAPRRVVYQISSACLPSVQRCFARAPSGQQCRPTLLEVFSLPSLRVGSRLVLSRVPHATLHCRASVFVLRSRTPHRLGRKLEVPSWRYQAERSKQKIVNSLIRWYLSLIHI